MPDRLLKPANVAKRLDISLRQLRRLVEWGHLAPPRPIGKGEKRFLESDVNTYILRLKHDALPPIPEEKRPPKRGKPDILGAQ